MICRKSSIFFIPLTALFFLSAEAKEISFDSQEPTQIAPLLSEVAVNIPAVQLSPRPIIEVYGEANDGEIVKLSPIANSTDRYPDGTHYTWVPGLNNAIFNMTCDPPANAPYAQYTWQLLTVT